MARILVIGAGLAGLSAALMLHQAGHRATVVSRGVGGLPLSPGTLSILGRYSGKIVRDYAEAFEQLVTEQPEHPYAVIGRDNVWAGVSWFADLTGMIGSEIEGSPRHNFFLPTALGAVRASAYVPESMAASALKDGGKYLIAGISSVKDFPASLIADNLNRLRDVSVHARTVIVNLHARPHETDSTAMNHARAFDEGKITEPDTSSHKNFQQEHQRVCREASCEFRSELCQQLRKHAYPGEIILLPAILGLDVTSYAELSRELGCAVGEIPLPPPSVPGMRLNNVLTRLCAQTRIDIQLNAAACGYEAEGDTVTGVKIQRAGRVSIERPDAVIYAAGGFESGALQRDSYGRLFESVFDLPVFTPQARGDDDLADTLVASGVRVNSRMNPLNEQGNPIYTNLFCAGSILGGARPWKEKSGEGIALGSAWAAVQALSADMDKTLTGGSSASRIPSHALLTGEEK